ncbi:hypothetical protein [Luteolibacter marinus]|uniref:hypothetical protein n=1 Tax=Luteolibacter marinus TaxID=2776705 RepID=UPI001867489F|nr:hypothetical protein [Luteolibacter marinus]
MNLIRRYSYSAALMVGVAIGLVGLSGRFRAAPEASNQSAGAGKVLAESSPFGSDTKKNTRSSGSTASASEYEAAWEILKDGRLPERERAALQSLILQQWSLLDLPGAIHAAAVDQDTGAWSISDGELRKSLRPGLAADPERAWHLIQTHAAGFDTIWLREEWIQAVSIRNPDLVIKVASQLPTTDRGLAIETAIKGSRQVSEGGVGDEAVVEALLALPDGQFTGPEISGILGTVIPQQEIIERALQAHSPGVRRVYLEAYVYSQSPLLSLGLEIGLDSLPPDIRGEVAQIVESKQRVER